HGEVRWAVAESYNVARPSAQLVLRRMSVAADATPSRRARDLVGERGWTLSAILDALGELVDLGLADVDRRGTGEPRFRLHPTVAAFGRERLAAEDDAEEIERRYVVAACALARAARSFPDR